MNPEAANGEAGNCDGTAGKAPIALTRWPGGTYAARHGRLESWSWQQVVDAARAPVVTTDKHAVPGWAFVVGRYNRRRRQDITAVSAIVLDVDRGAPGDFEAVATRLTQAGIRALLHTTHSHTEAAPRFRVILPLAEPIAPTDFNAAWAQCVELIGVPVDVAGRDVSHTWRMPSHAPDADYAWCEIQGAPMAPVTIDHRTENGAQSDNAAGIARPEDAPESRFDGSDGSRVVMHDNPLSGAISSSSASVMSSSSVSGSQFPRHASTGHAGQERDDSRSGHDFREALKLLRAGHDFAAVCDLLLDSSAKAAELSTPTDPRATPADHAAHQHRARQYIKRTVEAASKLVTYATIVDCRIVVEPAYAARSELVRLLVELECDDGTQHRCRIVVPSEAYDSGPVWDRWEALTADLEGETLADIAAALVDRRVVLRLEDDKVAWVQRLAA